MNSLTLSRPLLGFVVGTRAALAFGVGLLLADRIPESRRRTIAISLIGFGAATTIPALKAVWGRNHEASPSRRLHQVADLSN
jgi:drug/metabolite transporter (DMT)-like permease